MSDLTSFWQYLPTRIDPVLFEIGSFQIRWYGLSYIAAFVVVWRLLLVRVRRSEGPYTREMVEGFLFWAVVGVLLGGRLGYVLFYDLSSYLDRPIEIFLPPISGMSYHGGVVGLFLAAGIFCRKRRLDFWAFADFVAPAMPLGYTFGRLGNFLNGELYGRPTSAPWGMHFTADPLHRLRHPSQLYEAFFEGILLFCLLWPLRNRRPFDGTHTALYLVGYGVVRFLIEFVREPDAHLGLVWSSYTAGQLLCVAMVGAGVFITATARLRARGKSG